MIIMDVINITVTYFEISGRYFMKDSIEIPIELANINNDGERHFRIRNYIEENYRNDEFILVVTDDEYDNRMIGIPIMLFPK